MSRLHNYIQTEQDALNLLYLIEFINTDEEQLNEGMSDILGKVKNLLPKMGITMGFKDGLIHQLSRSSLYVSKFIWNMLKYHTTGNKESKEILLELSKTKVSREQVMDFLFRLDILTLSMFTAPLKMLDALLGWNIHPTVMRKTDDVVERSRKAIEYLRDLIPTVPAKVAKKLDMNIKRIQILLGVE